MVVELKLIDMTGINAGDIKTIFKNFDGIFRISSIKLTKAITTTLSKPGRKRESFKFAIFNKVCNPRTKETITINSTTQIIPSRLFTLGRLNLLVSSFNIFFCSIHFLV